MDAAHVGVVFTVGNDLVGVGVGGESLTTESIGCSTKAKAGVVGNVGGVVTGSMTVVGLGFSIAIGSVGATGLLGVGFAIPVAGPADGPSVLVAGGSINLLGFVIPVAGVGVLVAGGSINLF